MGAEDLEVALGAPVPIRTIEHMAGGGVVGEFYQREGRAEEVFGQPVPAGMTPEFAQFGPAAGRGEVEAAIPGKYAGGHQYMRMRMPEQEVAEGHGRP